MWAKFMKKAYQEYDPALFEVPAGIVEAKIDPLSFNLYRMGCPDFILEEYISGTEPQEKCPLHAGGIKGWFKKIFKKGKN